MASSDHSISPTPDDLRSTEYLIIALETLSEAVSWTGIEDGYRNDDEPFEVLDSLHIEQG